MITRVASTPQTLSLPGKSITTFVAFEAAIKLREMSEGDVLELTTDATEPLTSDIAAWCGAAGHVLVDSRREAETAHFTIRKGRPPETQRRLAMIISDPGLLALLSPLGFALASELEGVDTNLYFQGPAVRVLKTGFQGNLEGWSRPFSRFARRGLSDVGHVPPQVKLAQIHELGGKLYTCGPSMERFGVKKDDLIFDDVHIVAYLTFMAVMKDADVSLYV